MAYSRSTIAWANGAAKTRHQDIINSGIEGMRVTKLRIPSTFY